MSTVPPSWIAPGLRLIEADASSGRLEMDWLEIGRLEMGWPEIAERAGALEAEFRNGGGRAVVRGDRASTVIAALVAAERAGVELLLARHGDAVSGNGVGEFLPAPSSLDDGGKSGRELTVLLETSGTTGVPKRTRHDVRRLRGRLRGTADPVARWLLTYEPAAFAGLQVILTALAAGATLVSIPGASAADLARAAVRHGATHVSGTPSFWRAFLMTLGAERPPLAAITLGGEAADQPLLDRLREAFPTAKIRHIYASTEAGALFAVADGRAGFPAAWLDTGVDGVTLRIRDGVLEVNSPRAMLGYTDRSDALSDGWLSTGDVVEVRGDRVLFAGRLDGRINVGGVKVSPESVEQLLLGVPGVEDALVKAAANPITGHIVTAFVVPASGTDEAMLRAAIREATAALPPAARPRLLTLVERIPLGATGKKVRGGTP